MCKFRQAIRIAGMVRQMLARQIEVTDDIEPTRRGDREPGPPASSLLRSVTPGRPLTSMPWVFRGFAVGLPRGLGDRGRRVSRS
jgi:hypothetical protein